MSTSKRVIHETQSSISAWADATFGSLKSIVRAGTRANEEMAELLTALAKDDIGKVGPEIADVVICLYRLAHNLGVNLSGEIDRKMAINRARKWVPDGTGHGYHVKG